MDNVENGFIKLSDAEFKKLTDFVYHKFGINLSQKRQLIEARLHSTLKSKNMSNFSDYISLLLNDTAGGELNDFLNKITTNYTYFARENDHFEFLQRQAMPYLVQRRKGELRIWSAACSSGQEPYNMAMAIDQFFGPKKRFWDTTILASDISVNVLRKAADGIYPADNINDLPATWRQLYFDNLPDRRVKVKDSIRKEVVFKIFNLMDAFPFKKKFDVIFCRNVMIYFDAPTKNRLINKFYDVLSEGGFLFIGHSESIDKSNTKFKTVGTAVYQKITM